MTNAQISSWRQSPFVVRRHYRVRHDFRALRGDFRAGEVLVYDHDVYSGYHEYTGYAFRQTGLEGFRVWNISDFDDLEVWRDLFEEIQTDEKPAA